MDQGDTLWWSQAYCPDTGRWCCLWCGTEPASAASHYHMSLSTGNREREQVHTGQWRSQHSKWCKKAQQWIVIRPLFAMFYCIWYRWWISACLPGTKVQPSTGWDRGVGCRICASQAGCRCSACCGWCVWCCRPAAGRSWPSGLASPFSRRACCSSATPLSPSWRTMQKKKRRDTAHLRIF